MPDFLLNPKLDRKSAYGPELQAILSIARAKEARAHIGGWAGYAPTPLHDLPAFAARTGIAQVLYKDEGQRFELKSFKALGGAYAVDRLVAARGRRGSPSPARPMATMAARSPGVRAAPASAP